MSILFTFGFRAKSAVYGNFSRRRTEAKRIKRAHRSCWLYGNSISPCLFSSFLKRSYIKYQSRTVNICHHRLQKLILSPKFSSGILIYFGRKFRFQHNKYVNSCRYQGKRSEEDTESLFAEWFWLIFNISCLNSTFGFAQRINFK